MAEQEKAVRATGVQSLGRAFELLETMADAGGTIGALAARHGRGATAADHPPARAHPRRPGLRAPGALPAVHVRPQADPAR